MGFDGRLERLHVTQSDTCAAMRACVLVIRLYVALRCRAISRGREASALPLLQTDDRRKGLAANLEPRQARRECDLLHLKFGSQNCDLLTWGGLNPKLRCAAPPPSAAIPLPERRYRTDLPPFIAGSKQTGNYRGRFGLPWIALWQTHRLGAALRHA